MVWWVAAGEVASIPDQFSALATALGVEPAADPEVLRAQVHEALRGTAGWAQRLLRGPRRCDVPNPQGTRDPLLAK